MLNKHALSDLDLIKCLNANYEIEVANLTLLPIGADPHASIYKVETCDQIPYFIKLKQGHPYDISVEIVELLKGSGIKQIIPPVKALDGKSTQRIDGNTLIVYPFIDGEDGFSRNLTDDQWIQLGKVLKQIHELEVPLSIKYRIRKETYSTKSCDAARALYAQIEADPIPDPIALKLHNFMNKNMPHIHRLVDRAEQLREKLQNYPLRFVLCHSDIHGGNVLMDKNSNIYIVDWDQPIMAPKERDLMFIGGGVGNIWNNAFEENLFYNGYGKTEIHSTALAYYRHERIVEDIAIYGRDLLLTTNGGESRSEMYRQFTAMFEPHGVVDIAFKTDKSYPN